MASLRTKKAIISVHSDFTPEKPRIPSPVDLTTPSPTRARPPLSTKPSNDFVINRFSLQTVRPHENGKAEKGKLPKGRAAKMKAAAIIDLSSPPSTPESVQVRPRKRFNRRIVARSPSSSLSTPPRSEHKRAQARQALNGVVLQSRHRRTSPDIADRLAEITIETTPARGTPSRSTYMADDDLEELLAACSSDTVHHFTSFLSSTTFLDLVPGNNECTITKVGEASYSEVYGISAGAEDIVIKVIPLTSTISQGSHEEDAPDCSAPTDVLREVRISRLLSDLPGKGFVPFLGAFVVQGAYPEQLLERWDQFKADFGSESTRPSAFNDTQQFAIIVLADGGDDLETIKFDSPSSWIQAASVFWQTAVALTEAEQVLDFEHRDLHEGQILIAPYPVSASNFDPLDPAASGVKVTVIDFGLSRLKDENGTVISVSPPEEVYEGVGDQWDVYRTMRDNVADWEDYVPLSNLMWLNYILRYILRSKGLRKPRAPNTKSTLGNVASSPARPAKRIPLTKASKTKAAGSGKADMLRAYEMMKELEGLLGAELRGSNRRRQLGSAQDLLDMARERGWVDC